MGVPVMGRLEKVMGVMGRKRGVTMGRGSDGLTRIE